jgi:hypothetical protein
MLRFSMNRFVSKCIAEFGATAPLALRSGNAPSSELHARVCGEYSVAYVDGEFDPSGGVRHARHEIEVRLMRLVVGAVVAAMNRDPRKRRSCVYPTPS